MAKTFHAEGHILPLTAPSGGVEAGLGYVIGTLFVIAENTAAQGDPFEGIRWGVHRLPKTSGDTPAEGVAAYWDATAEEVTTTVGTNKLIGAFTKAALSADVHAYVILNQT